MEKTKVNIIDGLSLAERHTFALAARSSHALMLEDEQQLPSISPPSDRIQGKYWLLGEGSNTLFLEDIDALIIQVLLKGKGVIKEDQDFIWLRAAAGEHWDDFVSYSLTQGGFGLENLSWIPGSVGAAPIQNIGAYGVEVEAYIEVIKCWDFFRHQWVSIAKSDCDFSYRNSNFKSCWRGRYLITEVVFKLPKVPNVNTSYPDIDRALEASLPTPEMVREAVISVRKKKLPDPKQLPNAGSFFKNPILSQSDFNRLKSKFTDMVGFKIPGDQVKVAAGWLLEYLGFKGHRDGQFGCYCKQALILVNHLDGGSVSSGQDLRVYIRTICDSVRATFGLELEVEPVMVDQQLIDRLPLNSVL